MTNVKKTYLEVMNEAYEEAVFFTETGDLDQPDFDDQLCGEDAARAYLECRNFLWGLEELGLQKKYPAEQLGHDFWLTRNGHGAGFWDRPEIYGERESKILTAMAKAAGEHNVTFVSQI